LVDRFLDTEFAQKVARDYANLDPDVTYKLGGDLFDVSLVFAHGGASALQTHRAILGYGFPLFHQFFYEACPAAAKAFPFSCPIILSAIFEMLVQFCYLMAVPSFELDDFLENVDFGDQASQVLLFTALIYLDELQLCSRVRKSLACSDPPDRANIPADLQLIAASFTVLDDDPPYARQSVECVQESFAELLKDWEKFSDPAEFASPFPWVIDALRAAFTYGDVANLESFLLQCRTISDWKNVLSFPPNPAGCFRTGSGVAKFVAQPWYRDVYDQLITLTGCNPRSSIMMGSPGIGKSVFGLYFLGRLISSRRSIFGQYSVLLSWLPSKLSKRRWISVTFKGVATEITQTDFESAARAGAFAILDGMAFDKKEPYSHYLSIVSPSECVSQPTAKIRLYVPPVEPRDLDLLTGLSKRYRLRDTDTTGPPVRETHGTIESRMRIAGGNLLFLFSDDSMATLHDTFLVATRQIVFTQVPEFYFNGPKEGTAQPYHRAFACFPTSPYDDPGEFGFVSDHVMRLLQKAFADLDDKHVYDAIRIKRGAVNELLGFGLRTRSIRGKLFEDVCYDAMLRPKGDGLQLRLEPFAVTAQTPKAEYIPIPTINLFVEGPDLTSIPESFDVPWLWAASNASQRGLDALFFAGNSAIFILQMTTNITYPRVSLRDLEPSLAKWRRAGLSVYYVVLTDTLQSVVAIQKNEAGMIDPKEDLGAKLPQYAGVLTDAKQTYTVGDNTRRRISYYPPHTSSS
jgi:hypothetical protein